MPSYAKFLKDILSNKCKLDEHEMVILTGSVVLEFRKKKPSPKLKDLESFTVPCAIGDCYFDKLYVILAQVLI